MSPLRCELAGWLGDDLVSVHPDYMVTGTLADALRASELTGFELGEVVVTTSDQFTSYGGELPDRWERLIPAVVDGADSEVGHDIGWYGGELLVSDRALALLNEHRFTEADLYPAEETNETARFAQQRAAAREAAQARLAAQWDEEDAANAAEAARLTALLDESAGDGGSAPTKRTNAKREVAGDITRMVDALGAAIDDERVLAVLRLAPGPVVVQNEGSRYRLGSALDVFTREGAVTCININLLPQPGTDDAPAYPRLTDLVVGADPFTRDTVLELFGDPAATREHRTRKTISDEYRIARRPVRFYWHAADHSSWMVVVGKQA